MFDFFKNLWAIFTAARSRKAAAELPDGQAAVDRIKGDGLDIDKEIEREASSKPSRKPEGRP